MFGSVVGAKSGMTYHASNAEDPYLTQADATEDLADEEEEAYEVKPSDMMLLATRCEEEYFNMEVYIYEEEEEEEEQEEQEEGVLAQPGNLFIHHDLMLPDFALASAWTGFNPSAAEATRGNYVAVATAAPVIEVWNLDGEQQQ
jgi:periodic tryptophan protein 1